MILLKWSQSHLQCSALDARAVLLLRHPISFGMAGGLLPSSALHPAALSACQRTWSKLSTKDVRKLGFKQKIGIELEIPILHIYIYRYYTIDIFDICISTSIIVYAHRKVIKLQRTSLQRHTNSITSSAAKLHLGDLAHWYRNDDDDDDDHHHHSYYHHNHNHNHPVEFVGGYPMFKFKCISK